MNVEVLWENFLNNIKENISSLSYETWFRDTKLVSLRNNNRKYKKKRLKISLIFFRLLYIFSSINQ